MRQKWKWLQLKKQLYIHSIFRISLKNGKSKYESWTALKKLAIHSKGTEQIELLGFGSLYLKRDRKDPERTVRYSITKFNAPDDGKTLNKHAFDNAWSRIKTRNLHKTSTKPT